MDQKDSTITNHCERPGYCNCGNLGCNCGCYLCDGGQARGLTRPQWLQSKKQRVAHLKHLLASGVSHSNGYNIKAILWLTGLLSDPDEEE